MKEIIIELLQNEGKCAYHTIEEHLKVKGIEPKGKGVNKILQKMIDEDQSIERLDEKPRALYRIRLDSNKILEIHSIYFKEYMRSQFMNNFESIFDEISNKNKTQKEIELSDLKTWIEFFGLYVFTALIESTVITTKLEKQNGKEAYMLIHTWLTNALSLEQGVMRSSLTFEKMLKGFKKSKHEPINKTIQRMVSSLSKLYPQTTDIILNMGKRSDEVFDIIKDQKYENLNDLQQIFGILSGTTTEKTKEQLKERVKEKELHYKFNACR